MKEYEIISKIFAPVASSFQGSFGLRDDVAIFPKDKETDYVITTDSMLEGVHFLNDSKPEIIASRLMASNLSDIASSGATPKYFLLNGSISSKTNERWLQNFADRIKEVTEEFNIHLLGGDTIKSEDKLYFSATIIGEVPKGKCLKRTDAKAGDEIYVSDNIGKAYLGLKALQGKFNGLTQKDKEICIKKYNLPEPRVKLGRALLDIASACTDISDGLIIDLENICKSSGLNAEIYKNSIPVATKNNDLFHNLITGGDDYELIFTVPKEKSHIVKTLSSELSITLTKIGYMKKRDDENNKKDFVTILDENDREYKLTKKGYEHEI